MAINKLVILLILTITLHLTTSLPSETLTNAVDTLSNSGYVAMSLTLTLVSNLLLSNHNSATIFSPPDPIFSNHGQPSLNILKLHFSPMTFSPHSLHSLPYATKIPTVASNSFLTITTSSPSDHISLNNVKIIGSPIFDDGSLIMYSVESFFNPNFTIPNDDIPVVTFDHCTTSFRDGYNNSNLWFHDSANVLVSRGYSVIASFLNLQLLGIGLGDIRLTVFAPSDDVLVDYSGRFPDYQSLFYRHVLPCKVSWRDLVNVEDGTGFETYLDGFEIKVNRSGGGFKVNEVSITFPDMFYSDWIVVHGIGEVLSVTIPADEVIDGGGERVEETPVRSSGRELVGFSSDRSEF